MARAASRTAVSRSVAAKPAARWLALRAFRADARAARAEAASALARVSDPCTASNAVRRAANSLSAVARRWRQSVSCAWAVLAFLRSDSVSCAAAVVAACTAASASPRADATAASKSSCNAWRARSLSASWRCTPASVAWCVSATSDALAALRWASDSWRMTLLHSSTSSRPACARRRVTGASLPSSPCTLAAVAPLTAAGTSAVELLSDADGPPPPRAGARHASAWLT